MWACCPQETAHACYSARARGTHTRKTATVILGTNMVLVQLLVSSQRERNSCLEQSTFPRGRQAVLTLAGLGGERRSLLLKKGGVHIGNRKGRCSSPAPVCPAPGPGTTSRLASTTSTSGLCARVSGAEVEGAVASGARGGCAKGEGASASVARATKVGVPKVGGTRAGGAKGEGPSSRSWCSSLLFRRSATRRSWCLAYITQPMRCELTRAVDISMRASSRAALCMAGATGFVMTGACSLLTGQLNRCDVGTCHDLGIKHTASASQCTRTCMPKRQC